MNDILNSGEPLTPRRDPYFTIVVDDEISLGIPNEDDDELYYGLVKDNLDHLAPWMWWANEDFELDSSTQFIRDSLTDYYAGTAYPMWIYEKGVLVGSVQIRNLGSASKDVEVGYWLSEDAQGRGIATKAMSKLIDLAHEEYKFDRVVLQTAVNNEKSGRLAEQLGFVLEGIVLNDEQAEEKRYVKVMNDQAA